MLYSSSAAGTRMSHRSMWHHSFINASTLPFGWSLASSSVTWSARRKGQNKHRINPYTDIHALSGIRTHDPRVKASEDSSWLRPNSHCDRSLKSYHFQYTYYIHTPVGISGLLIQGLFFCKVTYTRYDVVSLVDFSRRNHKETDWAGDLFLWPVLEASFNLRHRHDTYLCASRCVSY
jgi:hypothetical protein